MAKGIIVVEMPEKCVECPCFDYDSYDCNVVRKCVMRNVSFGEKPDWCPILYMPERVNHRDYCDGGRYDKGWNDCVDYLEGRNGE